MLADTHGYAGISHIPHTHAHTQEWKPHAMFATEELTITHPISSVLFAATGMRTLGTTVLINIRPLSKKWCIRGQQIMLESRV